MKRTLVAVGILTVLVGCALRSPDAEPPKAVKADAIARALGLHGHRLEHLPSCVERIEALPDGRVVVVVRADAWPFATGGPKRDDAGGAVIWVPYRARRARGNIRAWLQLIDSRGRCFYSARSNQMWQGLSVLCGDGEKWHEFPFKPRSGRTITRFSGFVEDSQGRIWFSAGTDAVCLDAKDKITKLPFVSEKEEEADGVDFGFAEAPDGDIFVHPKSVSKWSRSRKKIKGGVRGWLLPKGEVAKAQPVDLPWPGCKAVALGSGYWYLSRHGEWPILMRLFTSGTGRLEEFREVVELLDDDDWAVREQATRRLVRDFRGLGREASEMLRTEKRIEVRDRLNKVIAAWRKRPARNEKWKGPLPGGEKFLRVQPVKMMGSSEHCYIVNGLWRKGQPEPQEPGNQYDLVKITKGCKLEVLVPKIKGRLYPDVNYLAFGRLPDGRLMVWNRYKKPKPVPHIWNGKKLVKVPESNFHLYNLAQLRSWRKDKAGRYYRWVWAYDPKGVPADKGYDTKTWAACAHGRRDSRNVIWTVLVAGKPSEYMRFRKKGHLVRFKGEDPERLAEIDLRNVEGKLVTPDYANGGKRPPLPDVIPFGPDAAIIGFRYRSYLYSGGKLEKFKTMGELLSKHWKAVAAGLRAEQKRYPRTRPIAIDASGNLWFAEPAAEKRPIGAVTTEGKLLKPKVYKELNWTGILPAAGGIVARRGYDKCVLLRVKGGALQETVLHQEGPGNYLDEIYSWTTPGGGAVIGGQMSLTAGGKTSRIYPAGSQSKLHDRTSSGWTSSYDVPAGGTYDMGRSLLSRDRLKVRLPHWLHQIIEPPGSREMLISCEYGLYRLAFKPEVDKRVSAFFEEVIPTCVYKRGYGAMFVGAHNPRDDFIDKTGQIWQVRQWRCTRITPPPKVRARLLWKKAPK
jgi:hypothetical protein